MRTKCDGNVLGQNYHYEVQNVVIKLLLIESDVAACLL